MKKLIALLLTTAMALSLASCGSSDSGTEQTSEPADTTEAAQEAEAPAEEPEEAPAEEAEGEPEEAAEEAPAEEAAPEEAAAPCVSNDYYSITVDNVTWDEEKVYIDVTYVNNDELPATFDLDVVDINGCRWYGGAYKTVEAGATVSATAEMRQDSNSIFDTVEAYAFVQPDEITIYPEVVNDDGDYDKSLTTPITFYPTGLTADTVEYPSYTPKDTDIVIIDEADMKVFITSINPRSFNDVYYLYIQNDTDTHIKLFADSETYQENGELCNTTFGWEEAYPGERVSTIIYMHEDEVQDFAGTFQITDYEDIWGDNILYSGDFAVTVADYDDGE